MLFPGAIEFVRAAAGAVPIAIASGALRHEIDEVMPPPASPDSSGPSSRRATRRRASHRRRPTGWRSSASQEAAGAALDPRRCVAIEDSRWGLESARGAGLRCVGVTNSYPADELTGAELVVGGLKELTLDALDRLCAGARSR